MPDLALDLERFATSSSHRAQNPGCVICFCRWNHASFRAWLLSWNLLYLMCSMSAMMRLLFLPAESRRDTLLTQGRHRHHKIAGNRQNFQIRAE
jgi:hypothetical protein